MLVDPWCPGSFWGSVGPSGREPVGVVTLAGKFGFDVFDLGLRDRLTEQSASAASRDTGRQHLGCSRYRATDSGRDAARSRSGYG